MAERKLVEKEIEEVRKLAVSGHLPTGIAKMKIVDLLVKARNFDYNNVDEIIAFHKEVDQMLFTNY
jgi:hypothetical protein